MGSPPKELRKRPSASAYLSNGKPRRRPVSATPGGSSTRRSAPSLLSRVPASAARAAAEHAAEQAEPSSASIASDGDVPGLSTAPSAGPPLIRTWSGGWAAAPPPKPLSAPRYRKPPQQERLWRTDGGLYLAQKEKYLKAEAEEAKREAEAALQPRHMTPAERRAHYAERARHHAALGHAYGSWANHMTYSGPHCHRDSWMYVRQRTHSPVTMRRMGPPA